MILRKIFNPLAVVRYMRVELVASLLLSGAVFYLYHDKHIEKVSLPFSVAAILGSALAIFIAFRNNNAYARWWEARTLWGGIVNSSRIFARQVVANATDAAATAKATPEQADAYIRELVLRQIAFAHALRLHLRRQSDFEALRSLLPPDEFVRAIVSQNVPNTLLLSQGMRIKEGMRLGLLGAFDNISLEPTLASFNNFQGGCERIKNTPLLRQYHFFTKLFLLVFMAVLPFSLIGDFSRMGEAWLMMPVSVLIAFVFGVMGRVGEVNEDPFENQITDVPLTALCNTIERDLKEMIGAEIPAKLLPVSGFIS